jgi:hypothetical protein
VRAVVLPRQAKKRCVVVVNRDLDIGKGGNGHDVKQPKKRAKPILLDARLAPSGRAGICFRTEPSLIKGAICGAGFKRPRMILLRF